MIRIALLAVLLFGSAPLARAERLWLVIAGSDASAAAIAQNAKRFASVAPNGLVAQMNDCGEKRNVFAWIAAISATEGRAKPALDRVRETVKDAYIKRCDVKPHSLLALRMNAVDPSIADVPATAVNWEEADRVSSARRLPDGRTLVIARYFSRAADDPLEGRRERVLLVDATGKQWILDENCPSAGSIAAKYGLVALQCAREQAADHLMHTVLVFDSSARKLMEIQRCRKPTWLNSAVLACDAESVRADGQLVLRRTRTEVPRKYGPK